MKNALIARYGSGKSITERIGMWQLWSKLEKKVAEDGDPLRTYARTGILFIREMRKTGASVETPDKISTGS
jgi:hypothetical protein